MKFLKLALVGLILLVQFAIDRLAWADVNLTKISAYTELTDSLNQLRLLKYSLLKYSLLKYSKQARSTGIFPN